MAGNEEVIESLKLEINVSVKGQNKLTSIQEKLANFATTLETVNDKLKEYQSIVGNIGNVKISVPKVTTPKVPQISKKGSGVETIAPQTQEMKEEADKANESMTRLEQTIQRMNRISPALGASLKSAAKAVGTLKEAAKNSVAHIKKLVSQFLRIAKMRAMRAIIRGIISGLREGIQNLAQFDSGFNKTMTDFVSSTLYLKNALATLAQPLLQIVLPVIETVIDYIVEAINRLNEFIAQIKGEGTYIAAKKATKQYAENMESASDSAKELKRTLMGFDEINKLNDNTSSAKAGKGGISASDMFEVRATDQGEDVVEKVRTTLRTIERIAGAMLLAVGCVLLVTGHIPLGIACIIAGIKLVKASLKYGEMEDKVGTTLAKIEAIVGTALLALGAIFAATGHIGIGVALMLIGATAIAGSVLIDWSKLSDKVATVCATISAIVSAAALAVGMVLIASPGHWGLAIALIAVGAIGLVSTLALNWNSLPERIKQVITAILATVGAASLAVGAILALSGVNIPLGIALMAAGGVALGTAVALNWDELSNKFRTAMSNLLTLAKQKLDELKEKFQNWKASLKTPHLQWQADGIQAQGVVRKLLETLNLPTSLPKLHIQWYATGGFPEDGLFFANHSELVGKFSNGRTAVANNQQIEAGIEEAAYRGFMRAMQGQGGSTTFIAQLNGKTIFEEVVRQNNNATKTYGSSPLTAF